METWRFKFAERGCQQDFTFNVVAEHLAGSNSNDNASEMTILSEWDLGSMLKEEDFTLKMLTVSVRILSVMLLDFWRDNLSLWVAKQALLLDFDSYLLDKFKIISAYNPK